MNDRKQHVIKMAHQLFIDKGFQATSIQDILEYSGISKGTFYNYFSSKNELLIALFKMIYTKMEHERNELLIGQDPSNIQTFMKQVELQMNTNRTNKLISLFEEVYFSNDAELKEFIKQSQLRMVRWIYERFIDIFGESKKPYLVDCAIMFTGILHHNLKYFGMAHESNTGIHQVVRYTVDRVAKMVDEVAETGEQLIQPEFLDNWLPSCQKLNQSFQQKLDQTITTLKKALHSDEEQSKCHELLDFIQSELLYSKNPRKFLIESALLSLKTDQTFLETKELQQLDQLVTAYFTQSEEID
ncbi:TetR/AcrR family transcriptional regulator [Ectobacillus funiculus]|uniref:TetR/AcrR family transcriptional regulator n=1 Tax=Ectobacillus funiculus TaxID=137993 RepID=UPI00101CC18F|nr:TetR/AcrR family transcriptional regulator [Ectobacillus funiculus]